MNIFQMKSKPHNNQKLQEFLKNGFVCIGWPNIGDLTDASKSEIRKRLESSYDESGHKLGYSLGQVNTFTNIMKKDDLVLVKDKEMVHIGIVGDYEYRKEFDNDIDGMCHRRSTQWKESIQLSQFSKEIQGLIRNRHTISKFSKPINVEDIDETLYGKDGITEEEKDKLSNLFEEAVGVLETELRSDNAELRLKAASELIRIKASGDFRE